MPEQLSRGHRELVTAPGDGATRLRDIGYDHLMFLAGPRLRRTAADIVVPVTLTSTALGPRGWGLGEAGGIQRQRAA